MKQGSTFAIPDARNRYLLASGCLLISLVLGAYMPFFLVAACAFQALLFRLSSPIALAILPTVIAYPLLFFFSRDLVWTAFLVFLLLLGFLMRRAQKKGASRNVWLGTIAVTLAITALAALAYALYLARGGISQAIIKDTFLDLKTVLLSFAEREFAAVEGMTPTDLEGFMLLLSEAFDLFVSVMPAIFGILVCLLALLVSYLYQVVCRLFSVPDGLPERNFILKLSLPYAGFYILLVAVSFFVDESTVLGIATMNLRVLFSFIIAMIGLRALSNKLSRVFPRVSPRAIALLLTVLFFLSPYAFLLWSVLAIVTAMQTIIAQFKARKKKN